MKLRFMLTQSNPGAVAYWGRRRKSGASDEAKRFLVIVSDIRFVLDYHKVLGDTLRYLGMDR